MLRQIFALQVPEMVQRWIYLEQVEVSRREGGWPSEGEVKRSEIFWWL